MGLVTKLDIQSRFTPEQEVLIRATGAAGVGTERLHELLSKDIDWESVIQTANSHGVTLALQQTLSRSYSRIPDTIVTYLEQQHKQYTKWNLQTTQELVTVLNSLGHENIDVIPYRGPALASGAYGSIGARQFTDLDILIRRDEIQSAKTVLADLGYRPKYELSKTKQLSRSQEWAYTHFTRDYPFFHPERQAPIELHWRVLDLNFPTNIGLETVWNHRETTTIAGQEINTLSPEDRLLTLCIHGSKHHWVRLMWICDIDRVIRNSSIDWETTVKRARKYHALRLFLLGPLLAHELYGTELPDVIRRLIADDDVLDELVSAVLSKLFDPKAIDPLDIYLFQQQSLTHWRDQLQLLVAGFLMPRRLEIEFVALPFSLIWLYFLIRPIRAVFLRAGLISE
jgi:hypothetical protein